MHNINRKVFFPPIILILITITFSQVNNEAFSSTISTINRWVLVNFGWLFSWSSFLFLILLIITYFSPIAKVKVGGAKAQPLLSKPRWFAISICTTIATGILSFHSIYALVIYALCHLLHSRTSIRIELL